MEKRLQNKIALVTGGSRGIGAAIAKRFAQEGCQVAFSYSASEEKAHSLLNELKKEKVDAVAIRADLANASDAENLVKKTIGHFGSIDILVNNAGVYKGGAIDDPNLDIDGINRQLAINLGGVFSTTRAAVPFIKNGGRIIIIGSINAERLFSSGGADYAASKAALVGYTHGWARDLGPKNITVNLIQPGPIDTDMNPEESDYAEVVKEMVALGRYGKPEEIAAAVAFLASNEASYISAATLTIDGGFLA